MRPQHIVTTHYHRVRMTVTALVTLILFVLTACGAGQIVSSPTHTPTTTAQTSCSVIGSPEVAATPSTNAPSAVDDLTPLSDEFNDSTSQSSWQNLSTVEGWPSQIDTFDINTTSPGNLYLVPITSTWFEEYHGVYFYKEVTGDFMVTTRIKATGKHTPVPTSAFSLSGIMARAPRTDTPQTWTAGHENWVFITTGIGNVGQGGPQIETKTTVDSHSILRLIPSQADWIDLRVVRVGHFFAMLYHFTGEPWRLSQCYDRPDLPPTLQVGLNAYTDWDTIDSRFSSHPVDFNRTQLTGPATHPDLIVQCDYLRFRRPPLSTALRSKIAAGQVALSDWLPAAMS